MKGKNNNKCPPISDIIALGASSIFDFQMQLAEPRAEREGKMGRKDQGHTPTGNDNDDDEYLEPFPEPGPGSSSGGGSGGDAGGGGGGGGGFSGTDEATGTWHGYCPDCGWRGGNRSIYRDAGNDVHEHNNGHISHGAYVVFQS